MDHINVSYHSSVVEIPVLFLATLEGVIHKMALLPNGNSTTVCLVEKIHMSTGVSPGLIFSMKLHKEQVSFPIVTWRCSEGKLFSFVELLESNGSAFIGCGANIQVQMHILCILVELTGIIEPYRFIPLLIAKPTFMMTTVFFIIKFLWCLLTF